MKFVKKPVIIEAEQLTWANWSKICEFVSKPYFVRGCYLNEKGEEVGNPEGKLGLKIKTLEGEMTASEGDWIIRGVKGEFYSCKPDIFEQTYSKVEEA